MGEDVTTRLLETDIFKHVRDSGLFHTSLGRSWISLGTPWKIMEDVEALESHGSPRSSWKP